MAETIFVLNSLDQMIPVWQSEYEVEAVLQKLISDYPELLPFGSDDSTRWLLVVQEAGIPDDSGVDRFALDHLLLDSEGIPTLVEVKRSTDSRIRREVVGQMLDYASHFVIHWTVERMQAEYAKTYVDKDVDPDTKMDEFLAGERTADEFWAQVKTNLLAKRIRLLFVADKIPSELRRIVEFLNEVTDPVEVLAVEVPQYVGQGIRTFVPKLLGQTIASRDRKKISSGEKSKWDQDRFIDTLRINAGAEAAAVVTRILDWVASKKLRLWWGSGAKDGSFFAVYNHGIDYWTFAVWTYGSVELQFQHMKGAQRPFSDPDRKMELLNKISTALDITLPSDAISRRPSVKLVPHLQSPQRLERFLAVWEWYMDEIRKANP